MSFVYFVQAGDDGPIKVGIADDPEGRLDELQVASHQELVLLGYMPGTLADEDWLHQRLASGWIRGEWFRPDTPGLRKIVLYAAHCDAEQTEHGRIRMRRVIERATEDFPPENVPGETRSANNGGDSVETAGIEPAQRSPRECGFCHGQSVQDAASWLDGRPRLPASCPRCGETNA